MQDSEVIKELKRIAKENKGLITPDSIVERAKSKTSILHKFFDWDDSIAAQKHRLHQARQLLRVTVEYIETYEDKPVKVFVSLTPDRLTREGYRTLTNVMEDEQLRGILLDDAVSDMETFKKKYALLRELEKVFMEMEEVITRVKKPHTTTERAYVKNIVPA
jgi:hypothetical protein